MDMGRSSHGALNKRSTTRDAAQGAQFAEGKIMGKQSLKAPTRLADPIHVKPKEISSARDVSSELAEALHAIRITCDPESGRWTASIADYKYFSAQGNTKAECEKNAEINLKWYLERRPKRT